MERKVLCLSHIFLFVLLCFCYLGLFINSQPKIKLYNETKLPSYFYLTADNTDLTQNQCFSRVSNSLPKNTVSSPNKAFLVFFTHCRKHTLITKYSFTHISNSLQKQSYSTFLCLTITENDIISISFYHIQFL